jgi:hypothetical protein
MEGDSFIKEEPRKEHKRNAGRKQERWAIVGRKL